MKGDPGPYMELAGPGVWVPRTVPYLEARRVAKQADFAQYGQRLVYRGKENAILCGFTLDCDCDEGCRLAELENDIEEPEPPEGYDACRVPAWHFTIEEG